MSAPDPWKGLRGIMAGTLILEAITVGLSLLVIEKLGGGIDSAGGWIVVALALLMVVASGVQRRPWGLKFALALQVAMIFCGLISLPLGVMGVIFALVWVCFLWFRADLKRRIAEHEAQN
ncbi:DUF4233 domain-containing protein [Pseudonocardiaceae bacterium YIM PH 21723]|nr:DUF4233 domain-containing protein [Pseudonocardiaceae bacterium YIM PH 21723]